MYLITLTLINSAVPLPGEIDADRIRALLGEHLDSALGVEHIRVRAVDGTLDLNLFLRGGLSHADASVTNATVNQVLECMTDWRQFGWESR